MAVVYTVKAPFWEPGFHLPLPNGQRIADAGLVQKTFYTIDTEELIHAYSAFGYWN